MHGKRDYQTQEAARAAYYRHSRQEIRSLLPEKAFRILDVGAGGGYTLRWLKSIYPNAITTGVELNTNLKDELEQNVDVAIFGNIDECIPRLDTFDLILLLDVLEHVPDSTQTLKSISRLLKNGGHVIVSVPNIAHLSVTLPLLMQRRFTYQDSGIMDRTHLRFFVEDTAVKLLNDANLIVVDGLIAGLEGPKSRLLDRLSFGFLRHHLAKQYIMVGEMADGGLVQSKVNWKPLE
jgi:2-polyprenyl-3-methyl-5-hydroxy-6-metoxy-1,4-benzoquinol methylase